MSQKSLALFVLGAILGGAFGTYLGQRLASDESRHELGTTHLDDLIGRFDDALQRFEATVVRPQFSEVAMAEPVRTEATPTSTQDSDFMNRVDSRLAALESAIENLCATAAVELAVDQIAIPTRRDAVQSTATRLESVEEQHALLENHFRWSKAQVHRAYGAPDRVADRGREWFYFISPPHNGMTRSLVFSFDGVFVIGLSIGYS